MEDRRIGRPNTPRRGRSTKSATCSPQAEDEARVRPAHQPAHARIEYGTATASELASSRKDDEGGTHLFILTSIQMRLRTHHPFKHMYIRYSPHHSAESAQVRSLVLEVRSVMHHGGREGPPPGAYFCTGIYGVWVHDTPKCPGARGGSRM